MIFTLMAAHDTSTITLAMMAYYLGKHPEWQDRLRAESQALGRDAIGYDDLDALPSLDLVMKETLRMNAPVGMLARAGGQGHRDPRATTSRPAPAMLAAIYPTQRMEPWWKDPDTFDPERFAEGRREDKSHRYAWAPFGGNVHKCIGMHFGGMEVKAIMHQLLLALPLEHACRLRAAADLRHRAVPRRRAADRAGSAGHARVTRIPRGRD